MASNIIQKALDKWSKNVTQDSSDTTEDDTTQSTASAQDIYDDIYSLSTLDSTYLPSSGLYTTPITRNIPNGTSQNIWFNGSPSWNTNTYAYTSYSPVVRDHDKHITVKLEDGTDEVISREDLIKYIYERKLVKNNEIVRTMYERYQVAVKLVRSDDDGDSGV